MFARNFLLVFCVLYFVFVCCFSKSSKPTDQPQRKTAQKIVHDESIEDVDEDKIDEIIHDADKHLVIIFYDGRAKCPGCEEALRELEEIDDDLEKSGYIEVVKTDDRNVAKEMGVHTFPALIYIRRKNPIFYDGGFSDSTEVLRWIRSHEEVATVHLEDDDFEDRTASAAPSDGALDWFVMFYNSKDEECNSLVAVWETVAHKLRGLVNVGKVDVAESDDVSERFKVEEDNECPDFLLFHRGKMYRHKDSARDVRSFTTFALHKYKEQRGHRVPDPPTMIEEMYEEIKEEIQHLVKEHESATIAVLGGIGIIVLIVSIVFGVKSYRSRKKKDT